MKNDRGIHSQTSAFILGFWSQAGGGWSQAVCAGRLWEGALGRDRLQPRVLPAGCRGKGEVNNPRQQKAQLLALLGSRTVALGTEGGASTCWVPGDGASCTIGVAFLGHTALGSKVF